MKKFAALCVALALTVSLSGCEDDTSADYESNPTTSDETTDTPEIQSGYGYDDLSAFVEYGILGASGDKMLLIGYNSNAQAFYLEVDTETNEATAYAGSLVMTPEGDATITDMTTNNTVTYVVTDSTIFTADGVEYDAMSIDKQGTLDKLASIFGIN